MHAIKLGVRRPDAEPVRAEPRVGPDEDNEVDRDSRQQGAHDVRPQHGEVVQVYMPGQRNTERQTGDAGQQG